MNDESIHFYQFDSFLMDRSERLLHNNNRTIPLPPKVFDTLLLLVENRGRIMTKDQLMESLWPNTFVEESSLSQNIFLARKALGDMTSTRHYIETIPKRGYRFIGNVQEIDRPAQHIVQHQFTSTQIVIADEIVTDDVTAAQVVTPKQPLLRRHARTAIAGIVGACILALGVVLFSQVRQQSAKRNAPPGSVAVLPFNTVGAQDENDLLGLGMADALIMRLGRMTEAKVLPTSSVFNYARRDRDALAIGADLGVDAVIEGTVQRDGDRLRISAHLIDAKNGKTIWAGTFDEKYDDIFALQDSVSEQIAWTMAPKISGGERKKTNQFTENTHAYEAYLMGVFFWNRRNKENVARAIPYFQQAIERDPGFARAYALLADCYFFNAQNGYNLVPAQEAWSRTREAAAKALALDETVAEAHTVMAFIKAASKDFVGAQKEHQRALELDPNFATGHLRYGYDLFNRLDLARAVVEFKRAQELDPLSAIANSALCFALVRSRDYDGAIRFGRRAIELDSNVLAGRHNLAEAYVSKGMYDEAMKLFAGRREDTSLLDWLYVAYINAKAGNRLEAQRILARLEQTVKRKPEQLLEDPDLSLNFVVTYFALNEQAQALVWLEKVKLDRFRIARINFDPGLEGLRSSATFESFLSRHKILPGRVSTARV